MPVRLVVVEIPFSFNDSVPVWLAVVILAKVDYEVGPISRVSKSLEFGEGQTLNYFQLPQETQRVLFVFRLSPK